MEKQALNQPQKTAGKIVKLPALRALYRVRCAVAGALVCVGVMMLTLLFTLPLVSWLCAWAAAAGASALSRTLYRRRSDRDQTNVLMLGTFSSALGAWLTGLCSALWRHVLGGGFIGAGVMLCVCALKQLDKAESVLLDIGELNENEVLADVRRMVKRNVLCSAALALAVCGITALVFGGPACAALAALAVLAVCTFRTPFDSHTMRQLEHFRSLAEPGKQLRAALNDKLLQKGYYKSWAMHALVKVVRWSYPHKLENVENLRMDEDNPIVFLGNHGNLYGPVACYAHIPCYVRPWSISNLMIDKAETLAYIYKYDFENAKWLLKPLRMPMARLVTHLSHWFTHAVEAVPVYRDHLRDLMKTFRQAVDAMETGDSMLIFPENPNAIEQDRGYETEGIGPLFTGFAMLAPIYYNRTGKCCRFVPVFASKKKRTLRFGTEIVYDPTNAPIDERDRIVNAISTQLTEMYHALED